MISAALAVPPLVSTTTGRFGHGCGFASRYVLDVVGARPRVSTTSCPGSRDRKSTRLNSSHSQISYAAFCLKKKYQVSYLLHRVTKMQTAHCIHAVHVDEL